MADGSLPNILQEVDIEMISDEICHTTKNTEMLTVSLNVKQRPLIGGGDNALWLAEEVGLF